MAVPTQDFLESLMPAANTVISQAAFVRRLLSIIPGAMVTIDGAKVTVSAERSSVSATLPDGVTFGTTAIIAPDISKANAPTTQSGKPPTNAAT